jgi:hypothetical protein
VTVRSKQLGIANPVTTSGNNIYTVPADHRAIVKSIYIENLHTAAQRVVMSVKSGSTNLVQLVVTPGAVNSATETSFLNVWLVMEAGQVLNILPLLGNVECVVSGAELAL